MRIVINYGTEHLEVSVRNGSLLEVHRAPPAPPLSDPARAVHAALETPHGFPALRQALTPEDHVAIVVDEHLPRFVELLTAILEYVTASHVATQAITLVCPPSSTGQPWLEELSEAFEDVHLEVHDPRDRRRLSYLATSKHGRRIYLNRTVVDADQSIVLAGRGFDPVLGYAGAAGALFPILSDEATRQEMAGRVSAEAASGHLSAVGKEAMDVAWLLGAPFMVQIIEGGGEEVAHVVAGLADAGAEGQRLQDVRWRVKVAQRADTVLASLSGDPRRHTYADMARALATAARVVQPGGRIILLSQARPALGPAAELLRQAEGPAQALSLLREHELPDEAAAFLWAGVAQQARIYLLSDLPHDTAEELFTTPLEDAGQVQRLLEADGSCVVLEDAHKVMAEVAEDLI